MTYQATTATIEGVRVAIRPVTDAPLYSPPLWRLEGVPYSERRAMRGIGWRWCKGIGYVTDNPAAVRYAERVLGAATGRECGG